VSPGWCPRSRTAAGRGPAREPPSWGAGGSRGCTAAPTSALSASRRAGFGATPQRRVHAEGSGTGSPVPALPPATVGPQPQGPRAQPRRPHAEGSAAGGQDVPRSLGTGAHAPCSHAAADEQEQRNPTALGCPALGTTTLPRRGKRCPSPSRCHPVVWQQRGYTSISPSRGGSQGSSHQLTASRQMDGRTRPATQQ